MAVPVPITKKIAAFVIVFVIGVVFADTGLQLFYRAIRGEFTWESIAKVEIFEVQYLDFVDDERYVIPDKTYQDDTIQFDEYGFRKGRHTASTTSANIVFLGDSVPFGFGSNGAQTIPSRASDLLRENGKPAPVINAAVPSYSLSQAVYRYIYDIEGKFPVSIVVLQIYDPAGNFFRLKHQWDVSENWYSTSAHRKIGTLRASAHSLLKYSSLYYFVWRYSGWFFEPVYNNTRYEGTDFPRYTDSIAGSLATLRAHMAPESHIILLPITRPTGIMERISEEERRPIELLNDTFASYAASAANVHFLDTRKLFKNYRDEEVFRDACCHLTDTGLTLEASHIADVILTIEKDAR